MAIVLLGFAGTSVAFLALLAVGAVDGNVPQLGRGNGVIRRVDRPGDFWYLVTLYVAAGAGLLAGSLWGLRKHLKGELWPTGRD